MNNDLVGKMYLTYDINNDSKKWAWVSDVKFAYRFLIRTDALRRLRYLNIRRGEVELVTYTWQPEDFAA